VSPSERISSVDVLRGFALLGILLMNILDFSLPGNSYEDPTGAGGATGLNLATWAITFILVRAKMLTIFSMLFGAGVVLLTSRVEERGGGAQIGDIYYRRALWLLAFGLAHAYFLWEGDILYYYAVVGLVLYPLRKLSAARLMLLGALVLAVLIPKNILENLEIQSLREKAAAADAAAAAGKALTDEQREDQRNWADKVKEWKPPASEIDKEIADHRAGYWKLFLRRQKNVSRSESKGFYRWGFFDTTSMMLLGMGLLKLGVFSGARSYREYAFMAVIGYVAGISINGYVAYRDIKNHFDLASLMFLWTPYASLNGLLGWCAWNVQRLALALAHLAVVMMVCKAGIWRWLTARLAAVGQMALTNYLTHTVVCTTIFNGYGFGLFGKLERFQVYGVVLAVWVFQLVVSKIWLNHFRFGPVEWLWRSLTYWQKQPMQLKVAVPLAVGVAAGPGD